MQLYRYVFSADKYVREVVNEGGEDDEIVDSDGEVISLIFLSLSYSVLYLWYFWYASGPADPYNWLTDPDRDPALSVSDLQDVNKKKFTKKVFCLLLFKGKFT